METFVQHFKDAAAAYGPNLIAAALIALIGWWMAKLVTGLVRRVLGRAGVEHTLVSFLANLVYLSALALVVIATLGKLGVNTTSFAAIIGAAGLAVGFALQGSLANFAAGVMLILFRPFKVGDFIEAAGVSGAVEEIQVFATILKTPDNKRVILGNSAVTSSNITNYSAQPTRRVDMVFGVGYGDDIAKAKKIIQEVLAADARVLADPAATVAVLELGDSSVNFAVRPWVKTADYWGVYFDTTEKIKLAFDASGVSIPFPQTDVHLHQAA